MTGNYPKKEVIQMAHKTATLPTQPVEGIDEPKAPSSQPNEPIPQGTEHPEDTGKTKVESPESVASKGKETPPASFFALRRELSQVKQMLNHLGDVEKTRNLARDKDPAPSPSQNLDEFWKTFQTDPNRVLKEIIENSIKENVPGMLSQTFAEREKEKQEQMKSEKLQEAENIMLSSEFAKKDNEFINRLEKIVTDNGLDYWGEVDPVAAMKRAIEFYQKEYSGSSKPQSTLAPTKAQMTASVSGTSGSQTPNSKTSLMEDLLKQAQANPTLFHDEDWNKKWKEASSV